MGKMQRERMRAEIRAGEMLVEMEKNKGAVPGKTGRKGLPVLDATPKLADLGVTKTRILTRAAEPTAILTRAVAVRPNSFDAAARTFAGAVLATSTPVRRRGYSEVLDFAGVQLPEHLPIVLDHRDDVRSTVGRMSNLRISNGELLGDGRLSGDASLDWLASRISDGTVGALSVGYTVARWRNDPQNVRTAIEWRPLHAAIVSSPADSSARIRSTDDPDPDDPEPDDPLVRAARVRSLSRALGLSREIETRAIAESWGDEQIMDAVLERRPALEIRTTRAQSLDDPDVYRRAAVDSLVARTTGSEPQGAARELAGLSWVDFHRRHLRRAGQSVAGLSDAEVIHRALSTSDLPLLAGDAFGISIRRTYDAALSPINTVFGTRELPDFRPWQEALVDWTTLKIDRVNELGEYKSSYVTESGESYRLFTVGGMTGISRQVWVNGPAQLTALSELHGRRLAADVSDRTVAYLEQSSGAGPTMKDGAGVFAASRGDIVSLNTAGITEVIDGVLDVRAAASRRKGAGDVQIGVVPTIWLITPEFEKTAIKALATIAATTVADVNPLAGKLTIVSEPRLSDPERSYLIAPPASMEGAIRVSLAGAGGPMTESRWGFEVDSVQFKIRLDLGFGWLEWRSWTRLDHEASS
jgi:hypothetical protein